MIKLKKNEEDLIENLKSSGKKVGKILPILEDYYGNIIDGLHRQEADKNWPRQRLENIKTEKDRIIMRLALNYIRRDAPAAEKTELLDKLGEILLKEEGVQPGEISRRIAEETGMSYTWVMKYLPDRFKDDSQQERASSATRRVTGFLNQSIRLAKIFKKAQSLRKSRIQIKNYANTHQSWIIAERSLYGEWERVTKEIAKQSGLDEEKAPHILFESMWLTVLEEIKRAVENYKTQETRQSIPKRK